MSIIRGFVKAKDYYEAVLESMTHVENTAILNHVQFRSCTWSISLFHRMGFVRRAGTTGKVEISAEAKKEVDLTFLHEIDNNVKKLQIPSSWVLNLDPTNSKHVSISKITVVEKGSNSVLISGWSDKRSMTGTFTNTFHRKSLPMQLIYGGNTNQSLPKFAFPLDFSSLLILNTTIILQSP